MDRRSCASPQQAPTDELDPASPVEPEARPAHSIIDSSNTSRPGARSDEIFQRPNSVTFVTAGAALAGRQVGPAVVSGLLSRGASTYVVATEVMGASKRASFASFAMTRT